LEVKGKVWVQEKDDKIFDAVIKIVFEKVIDRIKKI